jgi:7-carboxy-7-deazaguanine synthase
VVLRVSEYYLSYQGEGPNTGTPTIFLRFAGCNFKCPGWPCDTQFAIDPKIFTKEQTTYKYSKDLVDDVMTLWYPGVNICFTGGEVLLQPNDELEELASELVSRTGYGTALEMFTNGSLPLGKTLRKQFQSIILDWKLPGSGEAYGNPAVLYQNLSALRSTDAIKFTIRNYDDFEIAKNRYHTDILGGENSDGDPLLAPVFAGIVWESRSREADLVRWIQEAKLPWYLNVQLHKYIWDPEARRT